MRRANAALAALVLVPALFTAGALLPELTLGTPSNNDDATHFLLVQRASEALANGENVLDHWVPQLELGFPWFVYYQPLPALSVVALHRALLGLVDLLGVFDLVRYALLVGLPFTVFWSLRRLGVAPFGAAVAAGISPLLSGDFRYGFDYDSYIWRGFGMFTQLAAMHLSFVTLALLWSAIAGGRRRVMWAAISLAALVLSHLIYGYMMAVSALVLVVGGSISRRDLLARALRLVAVGVPAALLTAWLVLPFVTQVAYLGASPYLQAQKYDSWGAPAILGWLVGGDLLDHGRPPVATALLAIGLVAAALTRTPLARTALAGFVLWLVLYFGRPTLGGLIDLLPLHESLLLHRFIGSLELFAIVLIGIGAAYVYERVGAARSWRRLALASLGALLLFVPAFVERGAFYERNATWMRQTSDAIAADADARAILAAIRERAPGRVYAGLRNGGFGPQLDFGIPFNSARFSDLLVFNGFAVVAAPYSSLSLNADLIWDFTDGRPEDYDILDARYVVAPAQLAMPEFLKPLLRTGRYVLYEAPTSGYATFGALVDRQAAPTQRALFALDRPWFSGTDPAAHRFHRYDFAAPSDAPFVPTAACDRPHYSYERVQPSRLDLLVGCSNESTLVLKMTYHPNWHVEIDGVEARPFMVSPSYVGVSVPAGDHFVTAEYRATPMKLPLVALGGVTLVALLLLAAPALPARVRTGLARRRLGPAS